MKSPDKPRLKIGANQGYIKPPAALAPLTWNYSPAHKGSPVQGEGNKGPINVFQTFEEKKVVNHTTIYLDTNRKSSSNLKPKPPLRNSYLKPELSE